MGPRPQYTLAPLILGEDVRIAFLENSRPLVLAYFIFPLTIRAELAIVLNLDLK